MFLNIVFRLKELVIHMEESLDSNMTKEETQRRIYLLRVSKLAYFGYYVLLKTFEYSGEEAIKLPFTNEEWFAVLSAIVFYFTFAVRFFVHAYLINIAFKM